MPTMNMIRHGLSIGIERVNNHFFMSIKAVGKLTHEDYEKVTPLIDASLEGVKDPKVNVFLDASKFEGWKLRAAWDDFKIGLKHGSEFDRIAIFGNKKWQEYTAKIGTWFVSGEVKYFENADEALSWLQQSS